MDGERFVEVNAGLHSNQASQANINNKSITTIYDQTHCLNQSYNILRSSIMNDSNAKLKPMDESTVKAKLCLSQIKIQQSFKQPNKIFQSLLTTFIYIQCLKYPIDTYSASWLGSEMEIFSYLDLSKYTKQLPSLITSSVGISYFIFSFFFIFLHKKIEKPAIFIVAKVLQICFSTFLFMWIIGDACNTISSFFKKNQDSLPLVFAIISIILFTLSICLQTYLRFDFLSINSTSGVVRTSNWSGVSILFYIIINELTSKLSSNDSPIHLILMIISLIFHAFVFFLKSEQEQEPPFRLQLIGISINMLAIIMIACIKLINIKLDIGFLVILSIVLILSISQIQFFNIAFQLENVNKWSNSQIMISYAAKLRKVLLNVKNDYYYTLFLGYIEIHQQKCDNQSCPLAHSNITQINRKSKFEEIIRKIYMDGCKLSPVNPQLVLEYAIYHYEVGAKQKSMKMLLQIKQNDLPLDKYYKYIRLKGLIHRQISELPNQQFLDLLSQIKVKDLEEQITKKFQESALITLQFWSILNEDHPDFRKLTEVGKSKVEMSQKVHSLYKQINLIAHSERVTSLYIHYLNQIQNEQKMFLQIEDEIRSNFGYESKIVIEDWSNNSSPIMIISCEEQNYGTIIDLNTTCSTLLGSQRFDMLGRDIKIIFPGVLAHQIQNFIDPKYMKNNNEEYFYISYSNGYALKVSRRIQTYSSIETGLSLIITIQLKFTSNFGFIIFNSQSKLSAMSSTCLQLLNLQDNILESQIFYNELFNFRLEEINQQKTIMRLSDLIKNDKKSKNNLQIELDIKQSQRTLNVFKTVLEYFYIINFSLFKNVRNANKNEQLALHDENYHQYNRANIFQFQVYYEKNQFTFIGSSQKIVNRTDLQQIQAQNIEQKQENKRQVQDYASNITTLRLHENYIKVIQDSEAESQDGQSRSQTSTNNELIAKASKLPKSDEEKIFSSRQKYCEFIDKYSKKIYLRIGLGLSAIICIAIYFGLYFVIKTNYQTISESYSRIILQNQIIGQISQANRLILQTKYRSIKGNPHVDYLLLESFNKRLNQMQQLVKTYSDPYMIPVFVNSGTIQNFRSDEFILAYISQFSNLRNQVTNAANLTNLILNEDSSWYIQVNGNITKSKMYEFAEGFKSKSYQSSNRALNFIIFFNIGGLILSAIITMALFFALKSINEHKIEILSVFLQTTEKDIQAYSQKTQNFLITLHVDESNQNNEISEQLIDVKKSSSAMFTKKKRFKTTEFSKTPYLILSTFCIFASAFYIHCFSFTFQKQTFLVDAIEYLNIASKYEDLFSTNQALINRKFLDNVYANASVIDSALTNSINTNILSYERQYFTAHYKTYGSFDDYHQKFAEIFMKDICNGEIKVHHACQAGIMASNGTLLMLTDITVSNELIDFSKQLSSEYYFSMETIREAHLMLLEQIKKINTNFFMLIQTNILTILLIWSIVLATVTILIGLYVQKVICQDMIKVKSMLKFFPVSFARQSEGVTKFVAEISEQIGL